MKLQGSSDVDIKSLMENYKAPITEEIEEVEEESKTQEKFNKPL